jgi:hypothetical protein
MLMQRLSKMNDAEISILKTLIQRGERLLWSPEPEYSKIVIRIGEFDNEPTAFFTKGFITLSDAKLEEFYLVIKIKR